MALRALFPGCSFDAGERGGGGGLKPMCNLMELPPAHKPPINPCNRGIQFFFGFFCPPFFKLDTLPNHKINELDIWLLLRYRSTPIGICLMDVVVTSLIA